MSTMTPSTESTRVLCAGCGGGSQVCSHARNLQPVVRGSRLRSASLTMTYQTWEPRSARRPKPIDFPRGKSLELTLPLGPWGRSRFLEAPSRTAVCHSAVISTPSPATQ